jgi:MFS family permease
VSPVETAILTVKRAVLSFHPASMPRLSRAHYQRELAAWSLLPLMLGAVEGGVVGVLAKSIFAGSVTASTLNFAVAILSGAPALANVTSFLWAALSHGRHKIRFLVGLQVATALLVGLIALAPRSTLGLFIFTAGVVLSRMCWSGVVTVRSTVWRANYPRRARAKMAGRLASVQAATMAVVGFGIGLATSVQEDAFRVLYPLAAACGIVGVVIYRGLRMRGHRALIAAERESGETKRSFANPLALVRLLRADTRFRQYMVWMFVFGSGNLMVTAPLVIIVVDRFAFAPHVAVAVTSSISVILMPISIPIWAKLLDQMHVIRFRAIHAWAFVVSISTFLLGALLVQPSLLVVGAMLKGFAFGGGVLAWNLGHHDFARTERASQYMGVHVTLTGMRGLLAPVAGVVIYQQLEQYAPGAGAWVFAVCLSLTLAGALGFVWMSRTCERTTHTVDFGDTGPPVQPPAAG